MVRPRRCFLALSAGNLLVANSYDSRVQAEEEVPPSGVEPPRPCGHMNLNHARLPIPPRRRRVSFIAPDSRFLKVWSNVGNFISAEPGLSRSIDRGPCPGLSSLHPVSSDSWRGRAFGWATSGFWTQRTRLTGRVSGLFFGQGAVRHETDFAEKESRRHCRKLEKCFPAHVAMVLWTKGSGTFFAGSS